MQFIHQIIELNKNKKGHTTVLRCNRCLRRHWHCYHFNITIQWMSHTQNSETLMYR